MGISPRSIEKRIRRTDHSGGPENRPKLAAMVGRNRPQVKRDMEIQPFRLDAADSRLRQWLGNQGVAFVEVS